MLMRDLEFPAFLMFKVILKIKPRIFCSYFALLSSQIVTHCLLVYMSWKMYWGNTSHGIGLSSAVHESTGLH